MEKVIMDADWGCDDMELAAVLAGNRDKVQLLGATAVFGNTSQPQALENARDALHFLKADDVKVYAGAASPSDTLPLEGDNAFGNNGLGGVVLEKSPLPYETKPAVDFILEQLRANEPGSITITVSGPATNIAEAIRRDPETMKRVKRLVIMGGCTDDISAKDVPARRGNITYHGEFNFQQAAVDAKTVMESGLPITLMPMNCTHALTMTPERQAIVARTYMTNPKVKDALLQIMTASEQLDMPKFGSHAVMHDPNLAFYLLNPGNYETARGDVEVSPRDSVEGPDSRTGHTRFTPRDDSNVTVVTAIRDPGQCFDMFMKSITACVPPQQARGMIVNS